MKQLITICAVVCLILSAASVQAQVITDVVRAWGASGGQPEIAAWPDGLQEQVQAYMVRWGSGGRFYHWENLPDELVGADYVKTYNKDKKAKDVVYAVTVDQAARLYIFIDYRYIKAHGDPPFSWLTDSSCGAFFTNTGLKIILHEAEIPSPGDEPQRLFCIYAADVPAGYYKLGATYDGSGSRSFYGIAAVKLVDIDIKPGSYPNAINLGSKGVVPVAILSSPSFKATGVDPDTVVLGGASVAVRGKTDRSMAHEEDVNGDGLLDLVCQVDTENLDPGVLHTGLAILTARTDGGQPIQGKDKITIVT